jgi:type I restriction enzyme, S subunit
MVAGRGLGELRVTTTANDKAQSCRTDMHVTVADMKRLLVARPGSPVHSAFDRIAGPVQSRIFANEQQAVSLSVLRDTLLSRLISGQLRLPEAGALVA